MIRNKHINSISHYGAHLIVIIPISELVIWPRERILIYDVIDFFFMSWEIYKENMKIFSRLFF